MPLHSQNLVAPKSNHKQAKGRKSWGLGIEPLEDRRLMAINPALIDVIANPPTKVQLPESVGSITYNPSTRFVSVEASDAHNDQVNMTIDARGTASTSDDMVVISIKNLNLPLTARYNVSDVERIFAHLYGGNDRIENQTNVKLTAYGGAGMDVMIGGFADDALLGGDDNDYIDGRRGGDSIWGEAGVDALFGDDGIDLILGGANVDHIFGGNGDDTLYGEGDNDRLYGEAGLDRLIDPSGVNTLYSDYGPDYSVSASGFQAFDWFDRNLKDPDLRSLARLQYRNGLLERTDMLIIYPRIASDNLVNSNEFADLKALLSARLNMSADVRFFMNKIVNGDRANQWYHGGTLGNLAAGSNAFRLNALVDKWFKGGDLPAIGVAGARYDYVYGNLFVGLPSHTDVDQGSANDCYFLAPLGETAFRSLSTIQRMFASNGDGTFLVQFFRNGTPQFVTVNRFLPVDASGRAVYAGWGSVAGVGNMSNDPMNELWAALAEKAYVQLNESGWIGQNGVNRYEGIDFGFEAEAFGHITGKAGSFYELSNSGIIAALQAGKAITLATKDNGTASTIVPNHSYMLLGYNEGTKQFHLFNPHGLITVRPTELFLTWSEITANFLGSTSVML